MTDWRTPEAPKIDWSRHCPECAAGEPWHRMAWAVGGLAARMRGLGTAAERAAEAMRDNAEERSGD